MQRITPLGAGGSLAVRFRQSLASTTARGAHSAMATAPAQCPTAAVRPYPHSAPRRTFATSHPRPLRVAVEGNIATGKSTFLDIIKAAYPHITVVQEPIAKWTNVTEGEKNSEQKTSTEEPAKVERTLSETSGGNLLELFYKDANRWAYTFQMYAFLSRLKAQMNAAKDDPAGEWVAGSATAQCSGTLAATPRLDTRTHPQLAVSSTRRCMRTPMPAHVVACKKKKKLKKTPRACSLTPVATMLASQPRARRCTWSSDQSTRTASASRPTATRRGCSATWSTRSTPTFTRLWPRTSTR
eukprot:m.228621 g.228621  ORF g.228621 m.228621 type:complete len:298 (+) comp25980_c0_seq1:91-984(+)